MSSDPTMALERATLACGTPLSGGKGSRTKEQADALRRWTRSIDCVDRAFELFKKTGDPKYEKRMQNSGRSEIKWMNEYRRLGGKLPVER